MLLHLPWKVLQIPGRQILLQAEGHLAAVFQEMTPLLYGGNSSVCIIATTTLVSVGSVACSAGVLNANSGFRESASAFEFPLPGQ